MRDKDTDLPLFEETYDLASGQIFPIKDRSIRLAIQYFQALAVTTPNPELLISTAKAIEDYFYDYLDGESSEGLGE